MAADADDLATNRKSTTEMVGDFLREFALLVLVFVPLEFFLQGSGEYRWPAIISAFVFSTLLLVIGIVIERTRKT